MGNTPFRLNPECISCLVNGQLKLCPEDADTKQKVAYMQKVLQMIAEAPVSDSAPVIVRGIKRLQKDMFDIDRDFTEIKKHYNQLMLEKEPEMQQTLETAPDKLKLALQYAMTGNYIDFGAQIQVSEEELVQLLGDAAQVAVDEQEYAHLQQELAKAEKLVYLTDNCGEIVADKQLMGVLKELYPQLEITAIVRGYPVVNDATMEDAQQVGLTEQVKVLGSGSDVGGTCIEELSEEAYTALHGADVILAKGQGNFETMQQCGLNIYYIFLCKCEMFSRKFGVPKYTGMLVNERRQ